MTETKTPGDKTLHVSSPKTLTLKRPAEQGMVKQSFSHGRTNSVVVEKVKRRALGEPEKPAAPVARAAPVPTRPPAVAPLAPRSPPPTNAAPATTATATTAPAATATPPTVTTPARAPRPPVAADTAVAAEPPARLAAATEAPKPRPEPPTVTQAAPEPPPPVAAPAPKPVASATTTEAPRAPDTPVATAPQPAAAILAAPSAVLAAPSAAAPAPTPRLPIAGRPAPGGAAIQGRAGGARGGATSGRDRDRDRDRDRGSRSGGGAPAARPGAAPGKPAGAPRPAGGLVLRTLTDEERDARSSALVEARKREIEDRKRAEVESKERAERDERERLEREAAEARKREEEERRRHEDELKRRAAEEARRRLGDEPPRGPPSERTGLGPRGDRTAPGERRPANERAPGVLRSDRPAGSRPGGPGERGPAGDRPGGYRSDRPAGSGPRTEGHRTPRPIGAGTGPGTPAPMPGELPVNRRAGVVARAPGGQRDEEESARPARRTGAGAGAGASKAPTTPKAPRGGGDRRRGRVSVTTVHSTDEERTHSIASFKRRMQRLTGNRGGADKEKLAREVIIPETIAIQELANRMSERGVDVVRLLMKQGQMLKITDVIDADTAQLVAEELGHTVKRVAESDVEEGLFDTPDTEGDHTPRSPVVTIMGHVDHGKTSLLDAIRRADVASGEAGGITQHIGAYQVIGPNGGRITFIDTPGHAAFTQMRARGAKVTDIVVLVVAADDGVMPQTVEAINHAKAAKVPMIVAINKIDKPDAKPERVRTELLQYAVQVESLGGDVLDVEVSATKKLNLERLLETIELQAEVLNLRSNPDRPAEGTVIEAKLDRGRGAVATVLVQRGTLRVGDIVVAGAEFGRVRALVSDAGENVKEAGPSVPVEVLGFNATPEAGDRVAVVDSEARAREITDYRVRQKREKQVVRQSGARGSLAEMMKELKDGAGRKEFTLVIKGDVQGSVEAIVTALEKLGNDEVRARIIHSGVGGITESDITLAEASGAAVIGFNVRAHKEAREASERSSIEIRYYAIIYDLVDDVKAAMSGMLAPTLREERLGEAEILEVFNITKVGKVAGCRVRDGVVQRGAGVRLIRDNVVVHEGKLGQLKRFKDDATEVRAGQECGMNFESYQDMRVGDVIECYRVEEVKRTL